MLSNQLIRYGIVGVGAASTQFAVTYLGHALSPLTGLSAALGYLAGLCVSFLGQRHFTFKSQNALTQDMRNFAVLALAISCMNYGLMWGAIRLGTPVVFASGLCVVATTAASFSAMKLWIFRQAGE